MISAALSRCEQRALGPDWHKWVVQESVEAESARALALVLLGMLRQKAKRVDAQIGIDNESRGDGYISMKIVIASGTAVVLARTNDNALGTTEAIIVLATYTGIKCLYTAGLVATSIRIVVRYYMI
jgi:hypothetical protein